MEGLGGAAADSGLRRAVRWTGLVGGPLLAAWAYSAAPDSLVGQDGAVRAFGAPGRITLGLMVWMATWWMTEALEVATTALLPLVVLPVLGAGTIESAAAPYANPLVFLFLGGFLLAIGLQRHGLDRRIALIVLSVVGTRPASMVGGFMLATALLSASVSNTATVAMMLPIALSVVRLFEQGERAPSPAERRAFETSLFLGVAYAASIGGLATVVGSTPNAIAAGFCAGELGIRIDYLQWLAIGVPATALLLPAAWLLLTRVLFRLPREPLAGGRALLRRELAALGPLGRGEWTVLVVFAGTVTLWVSRGALARSLPGLSDAGIAMGAALALFVVPTDARRGEFALDWRAAAQVPWDVLLLFGGGLSLAAAIGANGVDELLGDAARGLGGLSPLVLGVVVTAGVVFLTELTSNTATATTLVPLLAALAPGLGVQPLALVVPTALAASCAFMLPVATPPNAMVFGSGRIRLQEMSRVGFFLNLAAVAAITAAWHLVSAPLLGL